MTIYIIYSAGHSSWDTRTSVLSVADHKRRVSMDKIDLTIMHSPAPAKSFRNM